MDGIGTAHHAVGHVVIGHNGSGVVPEWLGVAGTVTFLMVAASHLRHLHRTSGQRRAWHACHVLMAIGMTFMYAPHAIDPLSVPPGFWKVLFAMAGVLTAFWAVSGVGRVATLMWLLTALDLAVMLYMWSGTAQAGSGPLRALIVVYLVVEAGAWALDAYRQIDGAGTADLLAHTVRRSGPKPCATHSRRYRRRYRIVARGTRHRHLNGRDGARDGLHGRRDATDQLTHHRVNARPDCGETGRVACCPVRECSGLDPAVSSGPSSLIKS